MTESITLQQFDYQGINKKDENYCFLIYDFIMKWNVQLNDMICYDMRGKVTRHYLLCHAMLYHTMQCRAELSTAEQSSTVQSN